MAEKRDRERQTDKQTNEHRKRNRYEEKPREKSGDDIEKSEDKRHKDLRLVRWRAR